LFGTTLALTYYKAQSVWQLQLQFIETIQGSVAEFRIIL
jgi:hypothetical protein